MLQRGMLRGGALRRGVLLRGVIGVLLRGVLLRRGVLRGGPKRRGCRRRLLVCGILPRRGCVPWTGASVRRSLPSPRHVAPGCASIQWGGGGSIRLCPVLASIPISTP